MTPWDWATPPVTNYNDGANRLTSAVATGSASYNESFIYDQYGNMTSCTANPAEPQCLTPTYNTSTNRINYITSGGVNVNYTYDAAGDLTNDGTNTYYWDTEARLVEVTSAAGMISTNTYNALGQRVEDMTPTSTTDEAYGAGGNLLVRYTGDSNSRTFVPFGDGILAEYYCGGLIFDHPDQLGSATSSTDCTGNTVNAKLFLPYGEFWTGSANPNLGMHQMFAQLPDYDPETDEYNTANRHYSPSGRWLSPDPAGLAAVDPTNPQSWNRYAYVMNNPLANVDPLGLLTVVPPDPIDPEPPGPGPTDPDPSDPGDGDGNGTASCDNRQVLPGVRFFMGCGLGTSGNWPSTPQSLPDLPLSSTGGLFNIFAPNNPTQPTACQQTVLNTVNNQFGINGNASNILPSSNPLPAAGGEVNVNFSFSSGLTVTQFNAIQAGRYAPGGFWGWVTGYGPSLHVVAGPSGLDQTAMTFSNSNVGGNYSAVFTAHIDSAWADNPIGALLHWIIDVLGHGTRNPCP